MALNLAPPTAAQLKRSRELRELRNGGPRGAVAFEMLKKQLEAAFTLEGFAGVIKQGVKFSEVAGRLLVIGATWEYPDPKHSAVAWCAEAYCHHAAPDLRRLQRELKATAPVPVDDAKVKKAAKKKV